MINQDETKELGRILIEMRLIDPDELDRALMEYHKSGERLDTLLLKMGILTEEQILEALARQMGVRYTRLNEMEIPAKIIGRIPARLATHYKIIPVGIDGGALEVALSDPDFDSHKNIIREEVEKLTSHESTENEGILLDQLKDQLDMSE